MALMLAGGCVVAIVAAEAAVTTEGPTVAKQLGFDTKDLASRGAATILEALGLERTEAQKVAKRPLPRL